MAERRGTRADPRDRLIVALDVPALDEAEALADRLRGVVRWFKIGSQLFTAAGPRAIAAIAQRGRVFLDMKFHDIPTTVGAAVGAAAGHGVALCTVHASGGTEMMRAAREAAHGAFRDTGAGPARVIGVTLLTSIDERTLREIGAAGTPTEVALRLAHLAGAAGLDGVVVSPLEVEAVRAACGPEFLLVCPGIRAAGGATDDQRRVRTAGAAAGAGADLLVVGRPITHAPDPARAAEEVLREIEDAPAQPRPRA